MRLIRWVLVVTLGEAVGISVPAAVGVAVTGASWGPLATLVAMVLAGFGCYSRRSRWMTGARRTKPGESVVRPMRTSNSQAPNVGVGFIFGRLQLELDVESRDPIMDRNHRIQVEL